MLINEGIKETYTHTHTHWNTIQTSKKEGNPVIPDSMDESGDC